MTVPCCRYSLPFTLFFFLRRIGREKEREYERSISAREKGSYTPVSFLPFLFWVSDEAGTLSSFFSLPAGKNNIGDCWTKTLGMVPCLTWPHYFPFPCLSFFFFRTGSSSASVLPSIPLSSPPFFFFFLFFLRDFVCRRKRHLFPTVCMVLLPFFFSPRDLRG